MNLLERTFYGNPLYDWLVAAAIGIVLASLFHFEQENLKFANPTCRLHLRRVTGGAHG